jgi:hypothetical protein
MGALTAPRSDGVPGDPHNPSSSEGLAGAGAVGGGPTAAAPADRSGTTAVSRRDRAWAAPESPGGDLDDRGHRAGGQGGSGRPAEQPVSARAGVPGAWTGAGLAGAAQAPVTDERGWSDRAPAGGPPPLPAPLRPLTLSDLLDGAWAIIACRPRTVLGLSALIIVPAEVAASFLVRGYGQALDAGTLISVLVPFVSADDAGRSLSFSVSAVLATVVLSMAYTVLGAALGRLVAAWYDDTDLTVGQVLAATARAAPALLVAWIVMAALQVLSIAAEVLPALFVFPLLLLVAPIITIERRGPFAAIRRSARLVRRRYAAVMGIWLISLVLERILDVALAAAPAVLAAAAPGEIAQLLRPAGWAFALFITAPTVAGLSVLLYFDLRVRSEGLDLEVEAADAFPPVGPAHGR